MARGKPDSQHELVASGLGRCLKLAYPSAELSFGTVALDLSLKPDVFVIHPDGRRWAYEVVNKNAATNKIEANHRAYAQAGVRDYWILWETRGPDTPLDDSMLTQSVWITNETGAGPRRYRLNNLQRTLAALGDGTLYVFAINKPVQELADYWAVKIGMVGLLIYRFPTDRLETERVEGEYDLVPLPYLTFGEQGSPMPMSGTGEIPTFLQPFTELPSDRPVFLADFLAQLDRLAQSPDILATSMQDAFARIAEQYKGAGLPPTEELARAWKNLQETAADIKAHPSDKETDAIRTIEALNSLIEALPTPLRQALREALPVRGRALRGIFEMKRWLEGDEHLQRLLSEI